MEHKDTQKYDSDTMKMPKKEKEKKKKKHLWGYAEI